MKKLVAVVVCLGLWPLAAAAAEPSFALEPGALPAITADALAMPVFAGEEEPALLRSAAPALATALRTAREQGSWPEKPGDALVLPAPAGLAARSLLIVAAGVRSSWGAEPLRRVAGVAVRRTPPRARSLALWLPGGELPPAASVSAAVEGALVGSFDPGLHKTAPERRDLALVQLAGATGPANEAAAALERGLWLGRAQNQTRRLAVEPANKMTPELLARHAQEVARESGLQVEVFAGADLERLNLGGTIAVGKGSANAPRFIVLRYVPAQPSTVRLALAGKGVCFDSGGISLKDGEGMHRMKGDMAGGAAVISAMGAIARLKPQVEVIGIVPAIENMPSGTAQKPGDVFVGPAGKSVEVMSTDAEGRLILSDALSYAVAQGATHLVDVATLTGSVVRALGSGYTGAFATDEALYAAVQRAADRAGEPIWRLPLDDDFTRRVRTSLVADLVEGEGTGGGASIGAAFLREFTAGRPYVHLDIAGTSWPESRPWRADGPTGVATRTLALLALALSETPAR